MKVQYILTQALSNTLIDPVFQQAPDSNYNIVALNRLIGILSRWEDKIPFAVEYIFDNIIDMSNTQFNSVRNVSYVINGVPNELKQVSLDEWVRGRSPIDLSGFPYIYYFNEQIHQIEVFPTPNSPSYEFRVWGIQAFNPLTVNDDITPQVTPFMAEALIWELSQDLSAIYNLVWTDAKEQIRIKAVNYLNNKNDYDMKPDLMSVFGRPGSKIPRLNPFYYESGGA